MMKARKAGAAALSALALTGALVGCASGATVRVATPSAAVATAAGLSIESPWARTTTGTQDPSMTAIYLTVVNPTSTTVKLVGADVDPNVAAMCQVHEMVTVNGTVVMRETKDGIEVPAGSHAHLMPGGPHVMLMGLKHALAVGDEVTVTLHFSDGESRAVVAPVKQAPAETEPYHTHAAATPTR